MRALLCALLALLPASAWAAAADGLLLQRHRPRRGRSHPPAHAGGHSHHESHDHRNVSHHAQHRHGRRVAVLVSGQLVRFAYRDGLKRSLQEILCGADKCPFAVDVYVVLSDTKVTPWAGVFLSDFPPYGEGAFSPESIASFYRTRGAANVEVFLWGREQMEEKLLHVEARSAQVGSHEKGMPVMDWLEKLKTEPRFSRRWRSNGAMLLLRHKAYTAALKAQAGQSWEYERFLYLREDNAFVDGGQEDGLVSAFNTLAADVLVDEFCGFGSYSDKIYMVNRKGGDKLFSPTYNDLVQFMALWVNRVFDGDGPEDDPLQTESYLEFLLDSQDAKVKKMDFGRVDVRYEDGRACTPTIYYRCTAHPGHGGRFPPCDLWEAYNADSGYA